MLEQGSQFNDVDYIIWSGLLPSKAQTYDVPVLPLAGNVVFPKSVHPLTLQGDQAAQLVEAAERDDGLVALFMQRSPTADSHHPDDLYPVGTLARLDDLRR